MDCSVSVKCDDDARAESADGLCQRLSMACSRATPVLYDMSYSTRDRWEIDRRTVIMQALLGEGAFGQVWQGTFVRSTAHCTRTVAMRVQAALHQTAAIDHTKVAQLVDYK